MTPAQFLDDSLIIYAEACDMMGHDADAYVESLLEPLRLELERTHKRIKALDKPETILVSRGQGTSQVDTYEKDMPHDAAYRRWLRKTVAFCCKLIKD